MQIPQPLTLDEIPEDEQEALLTKVAMEDRETPPDRACNFILGNL